MTRDAAYHRAWRARRTATRLLDEAHVELLTMRYGELRAAVFAAERHYFDGLPAWHAIATAQAARR